MENSIQVSNLTLSDTRNQNQKKKIMGSFQRMFILFEKTFRDICTFKKTVILILLMMSLPLVVMYFTLKDQPFGDMSIESASMKLGFYLLPYIYLWTSGIILTIVLGSQSAGIIADEIAKGTMLILVSKPINRVQIFLGKYLAIVLYGLILSFSSIFLTGWFSVLFLSGNIDHFTGLLPMLWFFFVYSAFLNVLFVSISMALSSIMTKGKKVGGIIIGLIIMTYLGFFMIRMLLNDSYQTYYLYFIDISYHMGNLFVFFNSALNVIPESIYWQSFFSQFTGTYLGAPYDSAQQISVGSYALANYITPPVSFLIWVGMAILLVIFGLYKLQKREITN